MPSRFLRHALTVALLAATAAPLSVVHAQTWSQRIEMWRRRGSWSEMQALSGELERAFRLAMPTMKQEFLLEPVCKFSTVTRRLLDGGWQPYRVRGDAGDLSPRIEVVRNDTTGATGLRLLTRDAMPLLQGVVDGGRPAELTAVTIWAGRDPAAGELDRRKTLLTQLVAQCQRSF